MEKVYKTIMICIIVVLLFVILHFLQIKTRTYYFATDLDKNGVQENVKIYVWTKTVLLDKIMGIDNYKMYYLISINDKQLYDSRRDSQSFMNWVNNIRIINREIYIEGNKYEPKKVYNCERVYKYENQGITKINETKELIVEK